MTKQIKYYDEFLTAGNEVQNMVPDLTESLANDINIELYLVPTSDDPKGYAIAVIAVKYNEGVFRYKYEGGRVLEYDPQEMLDICIRYIRRSWDLDMWRNYAKEEYQRQIKSGGIMGFIRRLLK